MCNIMMAGVVGQPAARAHREHSPPASHQPLLVPGYSPTVMYNMYHTIHLSYDIYDI